MLQTLNRKATSTFMLSLAGELTRVGLVWRAQIEARKLPESKLKVLRALGWDVVSKKQPERSDAPLRVVSRDRTIAALKVLGWKPSKRPLWDLDHHQEDLVFTKDGDWLLSLYEGAYGWELTLLGAHHIADEDIEVAINRIRGVTAIRVIPRIPQNHCELLLTVKGVGMGGYINNRHAMFSLTQSMCVQLAGTRGRVQEYDGLEMMMKVHSFTIVASPEAYSRKLGLSHAQMTVSSEYPSK